MARMGLPKKYAKMGFAKGWKAYKAAKRKAKTAMDKTFRRKKRTSRKRKSNTTTVTRRRATMPKAAKSATRRRTSRKRWTPASPTAIATDAVVVGGGAMGSTMAVNMLPMIKDQKPWIKALAQIILSAGAAGLTPRKHKRVRQFFAGGAAGGAITLLIPYIKNPWALSGRSRPLSAEELQSLTMGEPYQIKGAGTHMGAPVTINRRSAPNPAMGAPVNLMSGRFGKRGARNYAGNY